VLDEVSLSTAIVTRFNKQEAPEKPLTLADQNPANDALSIYISGHSQPIVIRPTRDVLLGRYDQRNSKLSGKILVDFTEYDGIRLGVSRHHAVIHVSNNGYLLEDLDSANGTLLNFSRIEAGVRYPVNSGDMIQLGQLGFYIHLGEKIRPDNVKGNQPDNLRDRSLVLLERGATTNLTTKEGISPNYINRRIMPYLTGLMAIQSTIDTHHQRTDARFEVKQMAFNKRRGGVGVKVLSYPEAIKYVSTVITPWKRSHFNQTLDKNELDTLMNSLVNTTAIASNDAEQIADSVQLICSSPLELSS